jgi:hypothetical protein
MNFEQQVKFRVLKLKEQLRLAEEISRFHLRITAEGRVDGEVRLTFSLGEYGDSVSGNDLNVVTEEFLRRHGWDLRHAPLCLPNAEQSVEETER